MFTKYARGMVYWCNIPKYDTNPNVQCGRRPVIIVSNNVANCLSNNITIVPCTTNTEKRAGQPTHHIVSLNPREESMVLCEDVITISKNLLDSFMGILDEHIMAEIDKCLMVALGLTDIHNPLLGDSMGKNRQSQKEEKQEKQEKQESIKRNTGRRVQGLEEMSKFITYYNKYGMDKTMKEYGVPTKSAIYQRLTWYKNKLEKGVK